MSHTSLRPSAADEFFKEPPGFYSKNTLNTTYTSDQVFGWDTTRDYSLSLLYDPVVPHSDYHKPTAIDALSEIFESVINYILPEDSLRLRWADKEFKKDVYKVHKIK